MDQERYELVDVIGSGGMATVWRARDTVLGRVVAVKRPHPAPADSTTLPRFAREARAAATVNHPNLVSVYDVGEDALGPYLVMEYIDGPSLAATTVAHEQIASFGMQVAAALGALHAAGIVHGDVKPANILVSGERFKLTDFGIARTGSDTSALTREGVIFATPEYAAPETLATGDRSAAGDVYALGAVLHELITGSRWSPANAGTQAMPPAAWLPVLSGALAQDADRRPSAEALGAELARLQRGETPLAATVRTAVPAPMPAPAPTTASAPTLMAEGSAEKQDAGRRATIIFVALLVVLAAVAGVAALTDDDGGGIATMVTVPAANDTSLVTTAAPAQTAPPATEPPVTEAPPTEAPATVVAETTRSPARELGQDLADLIAQEVTEGLDREEAIDIVDRLNEVIVAAEAGQTDQVERSLRDAGRLIDRSLQGETRDNAIALLVALGVELGVDPDKFAPDDPRRDNDEDDD